MNKIISYTLIALCASAAVSLAAPDTAALEAKEKAAWQAFKDKKPDDFKKLVSPDLVCVYAAGVSNLQGELDSMSKAETKSFELSDMKVVMSNPNTAIITYQAKLESSMGGTDTSGTYNCASVWHMKNGEWRAIFHTDMKAEAKQ